MGCNLFHCKLIVQSKLIEFASPSRAVEHASRKRQSEVKTVVKPELSHTQSKPGTKSQSVVCTQKLSRCTVHACAPRGRLLDFTLGLQSELRATWSSDSHSRSHFPPRLCPHLPRNTNGTWSDAFHWYANEGFRVNMRSWHGHIHMC